jgi:hypothetical protein
MNTPQTEESVGAETGSVTPLIKRKYQIILFVLAIFMILTPEFISEKMVLISIETICALVGLVTFWLYQGFRFQKIARPLRPFIVTRILQIITCLLVVMVIVLTLGDAMDQKIPYLVYWCVGIFLSLQFFQIFWLAKEAKHKYPDRCEFC